MNTQYVGIICSGKTPCLSSFPSLSHTHDLAASTPAKVQMKSAATCGGNLAPKEGMEVVERERDKKHQQMDPQLGDSIEYSVT